MLSLYLPRDARARLPEESVLVESVIAQLWFEQVDACGLARSRSMVLSIPVTGFCIDRSSLCHYRKISMGMLEICKCEGCGNHGSAQSRLEMSKVVSVTSRGQDVAVSEAFGRNRQYTRVSVCRSE